MMPLPNKSKRYLQVESICSFIDFFNKRAKINLSFMRYKADILNELSELDSELFWLLSDFLLSDTSASMLHTVDCFLDVYRENKKPLNRIELIKLKEVLNAHNKRIP